MTSLRIPRFHPRTHGFPFPNCYPPGTPVFTLPTPFGTIPLGDAHYGLCGGMIFAAMDHYYFNVPIPPGEADAALRHRFACRLMDSWNLPFGALKYYDWQRRPLASRFLTGIRVSRGLTARTVEDEWPLIRAELEAGRPVALGLVNVEGWDIGKIARNHQVMGYGYDFDESANEVTLLIYDPNYPGEEATLTVSLANPDAGSRIMHSHEGASVRGLFFTEYRKPVEPP